ncbi:MAG: ATP-binding protein [Deltaproteobacteria bacterium]|jgi:hypothetical protein|nr:ATP-binding protein [Deltaproteobacteria bacterium]
MKNINTSNYNFSNVISNNLIYADKTKHVWELAKTDGAYFLSRPRRFGKSLLLSTFEELFKGSADPLQDPQGLFKNLWISGKEPNYDFTDIYPIISLSMAMPNYSTDVLRLSIKSRLRDIADSYDIPLNDTIPELMFKDLILSLNRKYNKTVVLLVDEYDDPVSSVIDDPYLANKNARFLKGFYAIIKGYQKYFRFVMLTGVTRYLLLWESGVLNHLIDLTMLEKYADICGFTYEEFDKCFADRFQITMEQFKEKGLLEKNCGVSDFRETIFRQYDGYSWDGKTRVLNPYSLLNAFENENLDNYWFSIEPTKKLLNAILSKEPLGLTADKLRDLSKDSIISPSEINSMSPVPALFQTGYLTIDKITTVKKKYAAENNKLCYSFKTPNEEIKPTFLKDFSESLYQFLRIDKLNQKNNFIQAIKSENSNKLSILIDSFFGAIPASLHIHKEAYYHSVLYGYLEGLTDLIAFPEKPGADGTPDILLVIGEDLYIIVELKYKDNLELESVGDNHKIKTAMEKLAIYAIKTIDAKNYLRPYLAKAKKILKLGLGVYGRGRVVAILENEEQAKARAKLMAKTSRSAPCNGATSKTSAKK